MSPKIREATVDDAEAIARVHIVAWQVAYRGMIPDSVLDNLSLTDRMQRWTENLQRGDEQMLIAEHDGAVVGWAIFGPSEDPDATAHTGDLHGLYLDPAVWRKGFGTLLCAEVDRQLLEQSFTEETVWFLEANERARKFYASIGFVAEGVTRTKERAGVLVSEVRYKKPLGTGV